VSGPEQVDLVVIDLPGIIHQGAGKAEVAALIEEYVKSPQTLIMLVSEAKQDTELVTAIGTARQHDPAGHRTVRVLTKFDNFDSEDAKERACEWVTGGCGFFHTRKIGWHPIIPEPALCYLRTRGQGVQCLRGGA